MNKHHYIIIIFSIVFCVIILHTCNKENSRPSSNSDIANDKYNINITVNAQRELFPVMAKCILEGNSYLNLPPTLKWVITNRNSHSVNLTLVSEIPDWTSPSITNINLTANETKVVPQTAFGTKLLTEHSITPASIIFKAKINDAVIYEGAKNINIRPADEVIWSLYSPFDTAPLVAAWVTPNDDSIEKLLSNAKERRYFDRTLSGYQSSDVESQIRAIFNKVRNYGVSYVSSMMAFGKVGFTQRVRLPQESIAQKSANCIDGAVLLASLFENIGLEPLIILIPSHALVGVRLSPGSSETLFIETTILGRSSLKSIFTLEKTFDAAVREGSNQYNTAMQNNPNSVRIIDIKQERENGIYPLW